MLKEIEQLNAALAEPEVEAALDAWREGRMALLDEMRDAARKAASRHGLGDVVYALLSRIRGAQDEAFAALAPLVETEHEGSLLAVFEYGLGLGALGRGAELDPYIRRIKDRAPILAQILTMEYTVAVSEVEKALSFAESVERGAQDELPEIYHALAREGACFLRNIVALADAEQFRAAQVAMGAWGSRHIIHLPKPGWNYSVLTGVTAERVNFLDGVSSFDETTLADLNHDIEEHLRDVGASDYVLFDTAALGMLSFLGLKERATDGPVFWCLNPSLHTAYLRVRDLTQEIRGGRLKLFFEEDEEVPEFLIHAFTQIKPKHLRICGLSKKSEEIVQDLSQHLPESHVSSSWTDLASRRPDIELRWRRGNRQKRIIDLYVPMDTVYIRYAMQDLEECLIDQGYQVRKVPLDFVAVVLNLSFGSVAHRFAKAEPADLCIVANFTISGSMSLPDWIPSLTWMQDPLAFEGVAKQDESSWMLGFFTDQGEHSGTFLPDHVIPTYMPVYEKPFRRGLESFSKTDVREVLSLVSNIPDTPYKVFKNHHSADHYPRFEKLIGEFKECVDQGRWTAFDLECAQYQEFLRVSKGYTQAVVDILNRISNALRRKAIARACINNGHALDIYGKGWAEDPEFTPYARGHLVDRTKLANVFRSSAINIDPGGYVYFHPRQSECAFSGGFILYLNVYPGWGMRQMLEASEKILKCRDAEELQAIYAETNPSGMVEWRRLLGKHAGDLHASQCLARRQLGLAEGMDVEAVDRSFARVSFSTPQELQEKIVYYTENREEREAVAHEFARHCERHGNMARIFNEAFDRIFSS